MKHSLKYSVIVPIYNGEKTLYRCLDSLLLQNCKNAELILINDGSTDASGDICREYAMKFPNVIYLETANGGVSSARNMGLDRAAGEYILFVDCDDYVSEDYFETLDSIVGMDFVQFSRCIVQGTGKNYQKRNNGITENPEAFFKVLSRGIYQKTLNALWDKVYKREIIEEKGIRFLPQLSMGEDLLFNISYGVHCRSCRLEQRALYYVNTENPQSLSRKPRADLEEQFAILDSQVQRVIQSAPLEECHHRQLLAGLHAKRVRSVYALAKWLRLNGADRKTRLESIAVQCDVLKKEKLQCPKDGFIRWLKLPVDRKWVRIIDFAGGRLAAGR